MFFILSKVLTFLLSPFIWVIAVMLAALIVKRKTIKKRLFLTAFIMLLVFGNGFLFDQMVRWWEADPVMEHQLDATYDYAVVLGGMASHDSSMNRIIFHESIDRLLQTLDLYSQGHVDTIIISGGSARLIFKEKIESTVLKDYLVGIGMDEKRIIAETESRNTQENAANTLKLIENPEDLNILLVTSAFHMRRAEAVFNKKGIAVDIYPTHFISSTGPFNPVSIVLPSASTFSGWEMLIKEVVGLIMYKIKGYA